MLLPTCTSEAGTDEHTCGRCFLWRALILSNHQELGPSDILDPIISDYHTVAASI
jgi:hypothetical protein